MPNRTKVFVSYSHRDKDFLERFRVFIKPLERNHNIELWDDTKIPVGARWRREITKAIDSCKIAVLFISANFMASDFIIEDELPPLLKAAEDDGVVIVSVAVGVADVSDFEISELQWINNPDKPLNELIISKRDRVFLNLSKKIKEIMGASPSVVSQKTFQEISPSLPVEESGEQKSDGSADFDFHNDKSIPDFKQKEVEPRFLAEFVTDADGRLRRSGKYKNHFEIRLFIENAPRDTKQVVYELHDSYPKPIREVPRGRRDFEEHITSYGDYVVNIEILGDRILEMNDWLSSALENFYGKNPPREILEAIKQIEEH
jgi:hypothetical protein